MLIWNSDQHCYEANYDGHLMEVDGDMFAEGLADRVKTYMEEGLGEEAAYEKADAELSEAWVWDGCDGVIIDGVEQG